MTRRIQQYMGVGLIIILSAAATIMFTSAAYDNKNTSGDLVAGVLFVSLLGCLLKLAEWD